MKIPEIQCTEQGELTKTKGDKDYLNMRWVKTGETNQGRGKQL